MVDIDLQMEAIQKLRETKNKKMVELDELKHEIMLLESFCNSEELGKRVSKQWMKLDSLNSSLFTDIEDFELRKMFLNWKLNGLKITNYEKKLLKYDENIVTSVIKIGASYKDSGFNLTANIDQLRQGWSHDGHIEVSKLDIRVLDDSSEELNKFLKSVCERNSLQLFLRYYPVYYDIKCRRKETFGFISRTYDKSKISIDDESSILKIYGQHDRPQVDVHWRINMDVFGCIYSFVDLKVHPTGINDVYDELPEKFNVMKGLNGDKEAILDTVGAIASKAK